MANCTKVIFYRGEELWKQTFQGSFFVYLGNFIANHDSRLVHLTKIKKLIRDYAMLKMSACGDTMCEQKERLLYKERTFEE